MKQVLVTPHDIMLSIMDENLSLRFKDDVSHEDRMAFIQLIRDYINIEPKYHNEHVLVYDLIASARLFHHRLESLQPHMNNEDYELLCSIVAIQFTLYEQRTNPALIAARKAEEAAELEGLIQARTVAFF